jgi:hypothetical protein
VYQFEIFAGPQDAARKALRRKEKLVYRSIFFVFPFSRQFETETPFKNAASQVDFHATPQNATIISGRETRCVVAALRDYSQLQKTLQNLNRIVG